MNAWTLAITNLTTKTPPPPPEEGSKTCPTCGVRFEPKTNHHATTYCTEKCRSVMKARKEKELRHAAGIKPRGDRNAPRTCPHCQQEFVPKAITRTFCSVACSTKYRGQAAKLISYKRKEEYVTA